MLRKEKATGAFSKWNYLRRAERAARSEETTFGIDVPRAWKLEIKTAIAEVANDERRFEKFSRGGKGNSYAG